MTLPERPLLTFADFLQASSPVIPDEYSFTRNAYWYRSGSEALAEAIRHSGARTVWCPKLFCKESLRHVYQEIRLYDIDQHFRADFPSTDDAVVVVVHYFGFPPDCRMDGPVIEDCAHVMPGTLEPNDNPMIFSPRKFWPMPNGGMMTVGHSPSMEHATEDIPIGWAATQAIQRLPLPFHWLRRYQSPRPQTADGLPISCFTRRLAWHYEQQTEEIMAIRRRNYSLLMQYAEPLLGLLDRVCPYAFPMRGTKSQMTRLRKQGIPASLWPDDQSEIMLLPIHHQLTEEHMERIGKAL